MKIQTERLIIRFVTEDDWQSTKRIWQSIAESDLAQYDMPHSTDDDDVRRRIARWAAVKGGTEHMFFAVCFGDEMIGYVAFNIRDGGRYEVGYCFRCDCHGKGYAAESLKALLEYMRELGATGIYAGTALENKPSVALLTKLGFELKETEKVSFYKDEDGNDIVFDGGIFELVLGGRTKE